MQLIDLLFPEGLEVGNALESVARFYLGTTLARSLKKSP